MRKLVKAGLVALVLSLGLAAPVTAGSLEDGIAAATRGDYATALRLLRPLADQGDAAAQSNLVVMYANGRGVPQDYAAAVAWARKAAEQGNADAQSNLGTMYASGRGVPQDYVQAYKWYDLAAALPPALWTEMHQIAVKSRDRVAAKMTPAQIAEAQKLAREWKLK